MRILFAAFLLLSLMVCVNSPTWAGGVDDAEAGFVAAEKFDHDKAIRLLTKAIESGELSREQLSMVYLGRGIAWGKKDNFDKAIADDTRAIEINPKYADAYYNRGFAWRRKGDYDRAIADYTKVIEIDPMYAAAYNERGFVWRKKGDYDRAIADYTKAIEIDPNDYLAYNERGMAWQAKGDYDKAKADYAKRDELLEE